MVYLVFEDISVVEDLLVSLNSKRDQALRLVAKVRRLLLAGDC